MKQQGVSFYLSLRLCLFILATLSATSVSAQQQELNFCLLVSNGEQRTAYLEEIRRFERLHPQIDVNMRAYGSEEYKQRLEGWLRAEKHSDVMYWFGGERLNWFIRSGLVHSLDQLWPDRQWGQEFTDAAQSVVTYQGRVYAVPMHYYHWGIYYKKSLFERLNLTPPEDWQAFLQVGQRLKERGVTPIALGSKEFWPLAGWFDYLNLRINGLDFHQDLLRGMVSYQDARVKDLFRHWNELVSLDFFPSDNAQRTWRDAIPYLYRERAAMMLMGNFWVTQIPDDLRSDIGVIPFPRISEAVAQYEEAPTDILFIPANAANKEAAEVFMAYMADSDVQARLNTAMGMLSPSKKGQQELDDFLSAGRRILDTAQGVSQFYDRDSAQPIATQGMVHMQRFVNREASLSEVLQELDELKKASYDRFSIANDDQYRKPAEEMIQ